MNSGFRIDTEITRRHTLQQTKQAALIAMQNYEVSWQTIHFIQVSEHVTFRIETDSKEQFLLRIHPANKPREETISELEWLTALSVKGLIVPVPVPNREGDCITAAAPNDGEPLYATMLSWIEGEGLDRWALTDEHVRRMGALLAKLHEAGADFIPSANFVRPVWGSGSFQRDWAHLQQHHSHFISDEAMGLYGMAAAKAANCLDTFACNERNYGMIHADLHNGNVIYLEEEPYPIDFGRCGFGYYLYDMAQSILGLPPLKRALFIEGYEQNRKLEDNAISQLECFFIMALIEAYSFHAEMPLETEGLIEEQPSAQSILRAFLDSEPFLFQPFA